MASESAPESNTAETVSSGELNSWRRGFTPQAEIWNGRLAMLGLSVGLAVLLKKAGKLQVKLCSL